MEVYDVMKDKIILAFKDNHQDLVEAQKDGDYEEELRCEGYEQAMEFVLSLFGISHDEALRKKVK
jgi:hypothetical protein